MSIRHLRPALAAAACALIASATAAQCPQERLLPAEVQPFDGFGQAVALDGDVLYVGSPDWVEPVSGEERGRVYRLALDGTVLGSFNAGSGDDTRYGDALDADGDVVVVGAWTADVPVPNNGRAWIYTWNGAGWDTQIETADPPLQNGGFGRAVAVEGDVIAVGAPATLPSNAPKVFVYRRGVGAWTLEQVLENPFDPDEGSFFGIDVALSEGRLFVGSSRSDTAAESQGGAVFVFEHDGTSWQSTARVDNPLLHTDFQFGTSLDVDGDVLAVGAPAFAGPIGTGAALVFRETAPDVWTLEGSFEENAATSFASDVAVHGDVLLVGEQGAPGPSTQHGAVRAYAFDGVAWQQTHVLEPLDLEGGMLFGHAVDLDDQRWIAGARPLDAPAQQVGVSVFDPELVDFVDPWEDVGGAIQQPRLEARGPICCDLAVDLDAVSLRPDAVAWLVMGFSLAELPFKGGVMVPYPDLLLGPYATSPSGTWSLSIPIVAPVPPSSEIVVQLWIEDAFGPAGFKATNGVRAVSQP